MPQYKIYATLLDAYSWYRKSESTEAKQELINRINRVPFVSEAAAKGTAFNELIDALNSNTPCELSFEPGEIIYKGFAFREHIVKAFCEATKGSIPQVYVESEIETDNGMVLLYGIADEVLQDECTDIKTTGNYELPEFLQTWQHIVYPYCLNDMGIECNSFRYLITDFNTIYKEEYAYKPEKQLNRLKAELNDFIFFLEMNRDFIVDKKIFALDDVFIAEYIKEDRLTLFE